MSFAFCFQQEEKEQLNEYKTLVAGLNKRAKSIVQLKPRNPTSSIKGKLPIQAVCDFKQQEVRTPSDRFIVRLSMSSFSCITLNPGFCFRLRSIKETSVHSLTTLSPSSGRFWTALDTRQWCPLFASLYLRSTRRLWTVCPGENTVKQKKMCQVLQLLLFLHCLYFCPVLVWKEVNNRWCPCGRCCIQTWRACYHGSTWWETSHRYALGISPWWVVQDNIQHTVKPNI